jgi:predicted RNA binding protein YcfA (HicA-like mRNA interferase family)
MPQVPLLSGREVVRVFEKLDWQIARRRGSHIVLGERRNACDALSPRSQGSRSRYLRALIRAAGLTVEEFVRNAWFHFRSQRLNNSSLNFPPMPNRVRLPFRARYHRQQPCHALAMSRHGRSNCGRQRENFHFMRTWLV